MKKIILASLSIIILFAVTLDSKTRNKAFLSKDECYSDCNRRYSLKLKNCTREDDKSALYCYDLFKPWKERCKKGCDSTETKRNNSYRYKRKR